MMAGNSKDVEPSSLSKEKEEEKGSEKQLEEFNREMARKIKLRDMLWESPQIKELQLQLRTAYTRKELQAQLDEQKLNKMKNVVNRDVEKKEFEKSLLESQEEELAFKQQQTLAKLEYRKILQDQMMFKYREKEEEHKTMLKERELVDRAVKSAIEDERKELQQEIIKRDTCKKEIEAFKQAKAIWLKKEKEIEVDEEKRIAEYLDKKKKEEQELKEREMLKQERLRELQASVSNIVSQIEDSRQEHTRIIQLIVEEQERQKAEKRELEESMKLINSKLQLREAFTQQMQERLHRLHLEKLEEEEYIKKKMEEYEEDRKYQQMTAQRQKLMKLEYRISLQKEFEEKQNRRKKEEEQLLEFKRMEEEAANERNKMLEEERIKLLKEHAVNVLGFLPPGLLQPSDLPHLPPDVREFYCYNPEPLDPPPR